MLLRRARPDDADEVVRLAEMMYRSLALHLDEEVWELWRTSAVHTVQTRLGPDLVVVVAEDPPCRVTCWRAAPG